MAGSSALTDWISLGVLASSVPRDVVDEAIAETGRGARRAGGKLPPHVVVYLVMALALFAEDDYEEVAARLTEALRGWGCWGDWEVPTKGAITQARKRLGPEPMAQVFSQVAEPVADMDTTGAFLGPWRLMSVDGMERDVPDTDPNRAFFGVRGDDQAAFPKIGVVTVSECSSHAPVLAVLGPAAGGKGSGEQSLARTLYPRLDQDWLVIADRNFYNWKDWCTAAGTGAALLWRMKENARLPVLEMLPDGSYRSVLIASRITGGKRDALIAAARRGGALEQDQARYVRVIEYDVPDRAGDGKDKLIVLVTTITDVRAATAQALAGACHQRWEHETGNAQLKTCLRGPGRVLRPGSPDLIEQARGYLLTHHALSALICAAATSAGIDPDRVRFKRTLRVVRRAVGPAFPP
ncbi:MAG TPA: IS4 family transposase [Streptosporangiaceae bacterium]|nr:IS4 family transposase [Streptosporangiaceae bacterium]